MENTVTTTVTIPLDVYEDIREDRNRIKAVKVYLDNEPYPNSAMIRLLLGIPEDKNHD